MAFNKLTDAEAERLALLAEECGEVIQAIGKILRHGYQSNHPNGGPANRDLLEAELGDVSAAIRLMVESDDIIGTAVSSASDRKLARIHQYLHHQKDRANG
jgi:NTP pyrophosphatase (non-canonical NTP hydrolase)